MERPRAFAAGFEAGQEYLDVTEDVAHELANDETFAAVAYLEHYTDLYERTPTTPDAVAEEIGVARMALETALEKMGETFSRSVQSDGGHRHEFTRLPRRIGAHRVPACLRRHGAGSRCAGPVGRLLRDRA